MKTRKGEGDQRMREEERRRGGERRRGEEKRRGEEGEGGGRRRGEMGRRGGGRRRGGEELRFLAMRDGYSTLMIYCNLHKKINLVVSVEEYGLDF